MGELPCQCHHRPARRDGRFQDQELRLQMKAQLKQLIGMQAAQSREQIWKLNSWINESTADALALDGFKLCGDEMVLGGLM